MKKKENDYGALTPSDASIKIITPSHILKAAVTSSEKFTWPVKKESHHLNFAPCDMSQTMIN